MVTGHDGGSRMSLSVPPCAPGGRHDVRRRPVRETAVSHGAGANTMSR